MGGIPAPIPENIPSPVTPPDGSIGIDSDFILSSDNLAILSNAAASSLLSVSNIGATTANKINSTLDLIRSFENQEAFLLDGEVLNNLNSGSSSTAFNFTETGTSNHVKIILLLNTISPSNPAPTVVFKNNATSYSVNISTATDIKRIELNNIPASFVSSFQVENQTGTSFASYGNSILVVNL